MTDSSTFDSGAADRNAGNPNNGGRFRRFILDPKASVKTYVSESLTENNDPAHGENYKYNNQQSNQQQHPTSTPPYPQQALPPWPISPRLDQQGNNQQQYPASNPPYPPETSPYRPISAPLDPQVNHGQGPHHIESNQGTFEISIRPSNHDSQNGSIQPPNNGFAGYPSSQNGGHEHNGLQQQIPQHQSIDYATPFTQAPNVPEIYPSQHQDYNGGAPQGQLPPHGQQGSPFPHQQTLFAPSPQPSPQLPPIYPTHPAPQMQSLQGSLSPPQDRNVLLQSRYGPAPPPADSLNSSILAPRTYHRMIVDFETLKSVFYTAKAQPKHIELDPLALKLKTLARDIWTLRFTRASEFDYSDAAHEQIITFWKAQFEQWSDVLEDLVDPVQIRKDAATDLANDYLHLAGLDAPKAAVAAKPAVAKAAVASTTVKKTAAAAADGTVKKVAVKKAVAKPAAAAE